MDSIGNRVAIVSGLRTPFAKQMSYFRRITPVQLAIPVVQSLLLENGIPFSALQRLVFGSALTLPDEQNVAREIVLQSALTDQTDAYSVSRACATSLQALVSAAQGIYSQEIEIAIAGGVDSTSVVPLTVHPALADALLYGSKQKTLLRKLTAFKQMRLRHLLPQAPAVRDKSTQLRMGDAAEQMARDYGISRDEQDQYALRSHQLAAQAWQAHGFVQQVLPVAFAPYEAVFERDNVIRENVSLSQLTKLKPAFDAGLGSVTAATSSALTDGAAAVLLMSESKVQQLGIQPLGYLRSYAFVAHQAKVDMLMGPSFATPVALQRAGLTLQDMDVIEMHEAFAAQILANLTAFESKRFAQQHLNRSCEIGSIDMSKLNIEGGSLAYGHPFAATGARMVSQALNLLRRRGQQFALITACAAGGLGAALVVEAAQ